MATDIAMEQQIEHPPVTDTGTPGAPIETDAVIVGAGPVGLFQVFELGLLEIKAHIIDSLAHAGGQCIELYPDKPIYDIPAVPVCTGRELTESLLKQIAPFKAAFHLGQEVSVVRKRDDGRFDVQTNRDTRLIAKTLFIAGGVGSFQPRTLKVEGIERHRDTQLFYRVRDPSLFAGKHIVALDILDQANVNPALSYIRKFRTAVRKQHIPAPKIWGLHPYSDINRFSTSRTKKMLKAIGPKGEVWLTEASGIVAFGGGFPFNVKRAAAANKCMFTIAKLNRRIKRLYVFGWGAGGTFDSGLINADGTIRPGYTVVQKRQAARCKKP